MNYFPPLVCPSGLCLAGWLLLTGSPAFAAVISKADNAAVLNDPAAWSGGVVPGTADVANWDSSVLLANTTVGIGGAVAWEGLSVTNPEGPITVNAGANLTLGKSGMDLSLATQDLTWNAGVVLASVHQTWTAATGRTITLPALPVRTTSGGTSGSFLTGGTMSVATSGTVKLGTAASAAGIIMDGASNPFCTYGLSDWATLDAAGTVVATTYTDGVTANTNANIVGPVSVGTVAVSSVRFADSAAAQTVTITGNNTFTARGILVAPNVPGATITGGNTRSNRNGSGSGASGTLSIIQNSTAGSLIMDTTIPTASSSTPQVVAKSGPGRVVFLRGNAGNGKMFINEGTVQFGNGGTVGTPGTNDMVNLGVLEFTHSDGLPVSAIISGTGSVIQSGSGILTLSGANTYSGGTVVQAGTLSFATPANLGSGQITLSGGSLLWGTGNTTDISSRTVTLSANSSLNTNGNNVFLANGIGNGGAGQITKLGGGDLTLAGASSFSGGVVVSGGNLMVTNTVGSATGSGPVSVAAGSVLGGTGEIAGVVTVNAATVAPGVAGVGTLSVGGLNLNVGAVVNFEIASPSSGDLVDVKGTDGFTVTGGELRLFVPGTATPFATPGTYNLFKVAGNIQGTGISALSVGNSQPGLVYTLARSGDYVKLTIAVSSNLREWIYDGGDSWSTASRWNGSVPNGIGHAAALKTTLSAPSAITLDAVRTIGELAMESTPNGYTLTPGTGGSLVFDNSTAVVPVAALNYVGPSQAITADLLLSSPLKISSSSAADILTLSGSITGANALTKDGAGTLRVSGVNSFSALNLSAGILEFGSAALGAGPITVGQGTLRYTPGNTADISLNGLTLNTKGTIETNGNDVTLTAAIGGAGSLEKTGAGTLALQGNNTYLGLTSITGGQMNLSGINAASGLLLAANGVRVQATNADALGAATSSIQFNPGAGNNATLVMDGTFNIDAAHSIALTSGRATIDVAANVNTVGAGLSGPGTLRKLGTGTLILSGANSVNATGGTIVEDGLLQIASVLSLPAGIVTLNNEANLSVQAGMAVNLIANGTHTVTQLAGGQILSISGLTGAGQVSLVPSTTVIDITGSISSFTGTVVMPSGNYRFNYGGGTQGSASAAFDLGTEATNLNVRVGSGTVHLGALSGGAGTSLEGSGGGNTGAIVWSIGARGNDATFEGVVRNGAGGASVVKRGAGTQTLAGANVYLGTTTVMEGTLKFNGDSSAATGAVSVASGATLGGNGIIGGTVSVASGGNLTPGSSGTGQLQTGSVTLDGKLRITLDEAATPKATVLKVVGDLTLNATAVLSFNLPTTPLTGTGIVIASYTGSLINALVTTENVPDGYQLNYAFNDGLSSNNIALVRTAPPTPFQLWATANGLSGTDATSLADPDGDGVANILEFAFNSDPKNPAASGKLRVAIDHVGLTDVLTMTIPVRENSAFTDVTYQVGGADNIRYEIYGSVDLGGWLTQQVGTVEPALSTGLPALDLGWKYATFKISSPVETNAKAFLKVVVHDSD